MMRFTLLALLLMSLSIPLAAPAQQPPPPSSGSPSSSPSQPPQQKPQTNAEGEEKEGRAPVGAYMLAAIGVALVLVVVCMPSRKGTQG